MNKLDLVPKKKRLNVGLVAVALIVIFVGAVSCFGSASATPTLSSLAGTYSSSTTGYTIVLYANGTGTFGGHSGTWSILNETTFEGTYTILISPRTDYFTITDNGFIAVGTGNVYAKTTTPTESATPITSSTSESESPSPSPTVPEFSNESLALIVTMIAVATCTVALAKKTKKTI